MGQGLLVIGALRSPSDTPNSVGLLWTSMQRVAETVTYSAQQLKGINIHVLARFEPLIPASGRPQIHATGVGIGFVCDIRWYVWYADSLPMKPYRLLPR